MMIVRDQGAAQITRGYDLRRAGRTWTRYRSVIAASRNRAVLARITILNEMQKAPSGREMRPLYGTRKGTLLESVPLGCVYLDRAGGRAEMAFTLRRMFPQ
jgi:hypothetical protein